MKKNRILSLLSGAALLLAAGSCSDETLNSGAQEPGKLSPDGTGGVYMTVDFQMPDGTSSTRSETTDEGGSTGGTEIGSDEENNVTTALIVLASTEETTITGTETPDLHEYGFIVAGLVQNNRINYISPDQGSESKQYRATAKLQKENLNTFYGLYWDQSQQQYNIPPVYVFVFCNPTKELISMFTDADEGIEFGSAEWVNKTCDVRQGTDGEYNIGIWGSNSFLMNNKSLAKRLLPTKLLDWELFTSVDNPFHLSDENTKPGMDPVDNSNKNTVNPGGSVVVERSVARFDFKDGSKLGDNTYNVLYLTNAEGNIEDGTPIVSVQLQKMCLVNMGNQFYYLPRVSQNGQLNGPEYTLLGREKRWSRGSNGIYSGGNYVVGPYAVEFNAGIETNFSNYLNFPFFEDNGSYSNPDNNIQRWNVVKIEDVLKGRDDNYKGTDNTEGGANSFKPGDYKVWRYVVENVIPDGPENQVNGISTGVVFKGKILGTEEALSDGLYEEYWNKGYIKNLANCLNGKPCTYNGKNHTVTGESDKDPILYYYSGRLYMGWRHIRQAAIQAAVTINVSGDIEINRSNSLYKAVFGDGPIPNGMVYIPNTGTADEPVAGEGIEIKDPQWNTAANEVNSVEHLNWIKSANYAWSVWVGDAEDERGDDSTGTGNDPLSLMREAVTSAGITIFQSSYDDDYEAGYYCYYYYWNRHNDNGIDGTMGPMEFDVVRNNVYKLSVDQIARLGHPRIPENDPNDPTPNTPDESDEIYLDVRVQIAPWAVRLNSIKF